jgi:hypothetical protein
MELAQDLHLILLQLCFSDVGFSLVYS